MVAVTKDVKYIENPLVVGLGKQINIAYVYTRKYNFRRQHG